MQQKVPEEPLLCPICMELPERKVFQCKNGHTICEQCCASLESCPQCRVPFGEDKIRNRALEDLIGGMQIGCKHEEDGCKVEILRRDLPFHLSSCRFRPSGVCHHIGFIGCDFVSSQSNQLFQHLLADHNLKLVKGTATGQSMKSILDHMKAARKINRLFRLPVQVSENCRILQVAHCNMDQEQFSFFCIHFSEAADDCPYLASMDISVPGKGISLNWTGPPTYYKEVEDMINSPPFIIPIRYILKNMDEPQTRLGVTFTGKTEVTDGD